MSFLHAVSQLMDSYQPPSNYDERMLKLKDQAKQLDEKSANLLNRGTAEDEEEAGKVGIQVRILQHRIMAEEALWEVWHNTSSPTRGGQRKKYLNAENLLKEALPLAKMHYEEQVEDLQSLLNVVTNAGYLETCEEIRKKKAAAEPEPEPEPELELELQPEPGLAPVLDREPEPEPEP